jgi:hypothetical protein
MRVSTNSCAEPTFLWLWARAVWQGRASRWLGPELCDLHGASSSQPAVVKALSLRPDGMDLEVADVRKTTTDAYVAQSRIAIREALGPASAYTRLSQDVFALQEFRMRKPTTRKGRANVSVQFRRHHRFAPPL